MDPPRNRATQPLPSSPAVTSRSPPSIPSPPVPHPLQLRVPHHLQLRLLTAAGPAEVESHQLHHVGLQEVDVPQRRRLLLRQRARLGVEEATRAAVHGLLRNTALGCG